MAGLGIARDARPAARLVVPVLAASLLGGCAIGDDWSTPRAVPAPVGTLGAGFLAADPTPGPESTVVPQPGSWDDVHPGRGYRVVLVRAGDDGPTTALGDAVDAWARAEHVDLRTIDATAEDDLQPPIAQAIGMHPDLVVSVGNDLVDALAIVTASHLDQQFLVVGAEVAEPTGNVTSVDWSGASYRGEGLGMASTWDPASFTADRCGTAIRAGAAAVLSGVTGIVVWLD